MIDRFGPMPDEVKQLLEIVAIKALCRRAQSKRSTPARRASFAFRDNTFANPAGLVRYIRDRGPSARVRPT